MSHFAPGVGVLLALGALLSRVPWVRRVGRFLAYLVCASPAAIYSRQSQYITVKRLDVPAPEVFATGTASETECLIVDSVEALQAVHYAEVLPEYRGQRIHGLMFAARDAYFRARGGRVVAGVCLPDNVASLNALRRDGAFVAGTVERISLLRGRFVWDTPIAHIDTALARRGADPKLARSKRSVRVAVLRRAHARVTASSTTP